MSKNVVATVLNFLLTSRLVKLNQRVFHSSIIGVCHCDNSGHVELVVLCLIKVQLNVIRAPASGIRPTRLCSTMIPLRKGFAVGSVGDVSFMELNLDVCKQFVVACSTTVEASGFEFVDLVGYLLVQGS